MEVFGVAVPRERKGRQERWTGERAAAETCELFL